MKPRDSKVKQKKSIEFSSGDIGLIHSLDTPDSFTNPSDSIVIKFIDYYDSIDVWDTTILRCFTSKIYSRLYDKCIKLKNLEFLRSSEKMLGMLVSIMDLTEDKIILANTGGIIFHSIIIKVGMYRLQALRRTIEAGITRVVLNKIASNAEPDKNSPEMFTEYLLMAEELAERDPAFIEKALSKPDSILSIHSAFKSMFMNRPTLMRPLIVILSVLSANNEAMVILLNDGLITSLQNTSENIGTRIGIRIKRFLQGICVLSRNPMFTSRMLSSNILSGCVKILSKWYKLQGKIGSSCLKHLTGIIQNTIAVENGVETLRVLSVDSILQKICNRFPRTRTFDKLLPRFVSSFLAVRGKTELPVESFDSPFVFTLPKVKKQEDSDGDSSDSDDGSDKEDEDNQCDDKILPITKMSSYSLPSISIDVSNYCDYWSEFVMLKKFPFGTDQNKLLENLNSDLIQDMYDSLVAPVKPKNNLQLTSLRMSATVTDTRTAYADVSSRIHNIMPFVKLAFPDLNCSVKSQLPEPLGVFGKKKFRSKLFGMVKMSSATTQSGQETLVYDLDALVKSYPTNFKMTGNSDASRIGVKENTNSLEFESRFESGNLRKAFKIGDHEYNLTLSPDVNSKRHLNWFYFEVSNMVAGEQYTFNIINCERCKSQFTSGMKPVMFSVKESILGRAGWRRVGTEIYYYKNSFFKPPSKDKKRRTYYTASFTLKFPFSYDVCYIAYHYPYTYSNLLANLWNWQRIANPAIFRVERLCTTMIGNEVPIITITNPASDDNPVRKREVVFMTARVHPGESNSSWVMQGLLNSLLLSEPNFVELRNKYVFKIVPMLNVEGVVHGCSRCGLSDEDLNRFWRNPDPVLHPSVYHTKAVMLYAKAILHKTPYLYCDFHGHSTRKNVFLYGCNPTSSFKDKPEGDLDLDNNREKEMVGKLARLMKESSDVFSVSSCRYNVAKVRESTARVTVWRELGVQRSYTLETSFCGSDTGPNKGHHLGLEHLLGIGKSFCLALGRLDRSLALSKAPPDDKAACASSLSPEERPLPSNYGVLSPSPDH